MTNLPATLAGRNQATYKIFFSVQCPFLWFVNGPALS